jgi:hypothetical protein
MVRIDSAVIAVVIVSVAIAVVVVGGDRTERAHGSGNGKDSDRGQQRGFEISVFHFVPSKKEGVVRRRELLSSLNDGRV